MKSIFIVIFIIGILVTYLMLQRRGGAIKALMTFIVALILCGLSTVLLFEVFYPMQGIEPTRALWDRRDAAQANFYGSGLLASVVGPVVGMLLAGLRRRIRNRKDSQSGK